MGRHAKDPDKKMVNVPCKITPEALGEIAEIAEKDERAVSFVTRKLIGRGLVAYRRDGELDESPAKSKPRSNVKPRRAGKD